MKKAMVKIMVPVLLTIFVPGCKKEGNTLQPPAAVYAFPKNTEWVGTLDGTGFQYRRPCVLKFNTDDTFTMYANFLSFSSAGAEIRNDSISGTIISSEILPDARTRITTNIATSFNGVVTKYIYITNRTQITGVSADGNTATFQLDVFPSAGISVAGTRWKGAPWPKSKVPLIPYACPDLSNIILQADGSSVYSRDGQPVMLTQLVPLQYTYAQKGARVYMAGYKILPGNPEGAPIFVRNYFGVLMPTGDKMLVDSYSPDARLPNYLFTDEPYGPNGQTPQVFKY